MSAFNIGNYGTTFAGLLAEDRLPPLGQGQPHQPVEGELRKLTIETAFAGQPVGDRDMANACLAGLWLRFDYLHESHEISQTIETATGSYWHGLMHRREGDFGNSKYWFRRVGAHPIFKPLHAAAGDLAASETHAGTTFLTIQATWDPFAFIDLCEACVAGRSSAEMLSRLIQLREWELLFDYCYRGAVAVTS